MKLTLSPGLVKKSLSSHSWVGLLVGVLMYLVCLSGTVAVFYLEFERWEQPYVTEYTSYDPAAVQASYEQLLRENTEDTHHIFMLLPTEEMPRTTISTDTQGWFVNPDGTLAEKVGHEWTHLLTHLHLYLHLPSTWGMIVVSILGALLCGLIVSGFLAHPRIFKDAFNLRLKGSRHLEQADIHNRLSVWGAPFHLMIAITGAFFGLAALMAALFAGAFMNGDREAVIQTIYGEEPKLEQAVKPAAIDKALAQMHTIAPNAEPFYITMEDVGTPQQYLIVGARHSGRLIYAEQYRFDSDGNYLDNAGFTDGELGQQAIFSVYRIHFGHFGGFAVKVVYAILGLALTVVSVSGINIWLARRKTRDYLNNLWTGVVWGTPLALTFTAITQVIFGLPSVALYWVVTIAAMAFGQWINDDRQGKRLLLFANAVTLVVLVVAYCIKFGSNAFALLPLGVNSVLLLLALLFAFMATRLKGQQRVWSSEKINNPGLNEPA